MGRRSNAVPGIVGVAEVLMYLSQAFEHLKTSGSLHNLSGIVELQVSPVRADMLYCGDSHSWEAGTENDVSSTGDSAAL